MKKIILILLISYIITDVEIDALETKSYYNFDWKDKDEYEFFLIFTGIPDNLEVFLTNGTNKCLPTCNLIKTIAKCTLIGRYCTADAHNPDQKFYYDVFYTTSNSKFNETGGYGIFAFVTISVCSGYYLKYYLALLSLIIF